MVMYTQLVFLSSHLQLFSVSGSTGRNTRAIGKARRGTKLIPTSSRATLRGGRELERNKIATLENTQICTKYICLWSPRKQRTLLASLSRQTSRFKRSFSVTRESWAPCCPLASLAQRLSICYNNPVWQTLRPGRVIASGRH